MAWLRRLPHVRDHPKNNSTPEDPHGKWTTLRYAQRRVALFDAGLEQQQPLQQLADALVDAGVFSTDQPPNHVLVNEYFEPTQGIMAHTDGPLYASNTAIISMGGGDVLLNFTPRPIVVPAATAGGREDERETLITGDDTRNGVVIRQVLLQGNGSLVVFTNEDYTTHCHGIDEHIHVEVATPVCANATPGTQVDINICQASMNY